jgi:nitroreductase
MSDESKKNILNRIASNPNDYAHRYKGMLEKEAFNVFYNAPCVVVILGQADERNLHVDCALAAAYFMMSATSRGLGTCWINLGMDLRDPELLNQLGIEKNHKIIAPLTLGYPVNIPAAPNREETKILKIID